MTIRLYITASDFGCNRIYRVIYLIDFCQEWKFSFCTEFFAIMVNRSYFKYNFIEKV